jgi:hypothetical protein
MQLLKKMMRDFPYALFNITIKQNGTDDDHSNVVMPSTRLRESLAWKEKTAHEQVSS